MERAKKGGGIVAGIFGFLAFVVAVVEFWSPLLQGKPEALAGVGVAVVVIIAITLWTRHDAEGDLVFRVELATDPVPAPHPSSVPPLVSLYSRGFVIGDDGRVQPDARPPAKVDLRRRRVHLGGLDKQLPGGLKLAMTTAPPAVVHSAEYRYTHRFGREVAVGTLAATADLLPDRLVSPSAGSARTARTATSGTLCDFPPLHGAVPGPDLAWRGAVPPSQFGHPLDDLAPGARCGVAAEDSGHYCLTGVLSDPAHARFRDPDGTLDLASGRPFIPEETDCVDLRTDGRL